MACRGHGITVTQAQQTYAWGIVKRDDIHHQVLPIAGLGTYPCHVVEGTKGYTAYGEELIYERHRHRFEVNNAYRKQLVDAGMIINLPAIKPSII